MECRRCRGLMVEDHFYDGVGTQGFMSTTGWRCMNCGHAEDALIAANRRLHEASVLMQSSEKLQNAPAHQYLRANTATPAAA